MSELTEKQRQLADEMFTTSVFGKVIRRHENDDGTYRFEEIERNIHVIDFPLHPGEFIFKHHEKNPGFPPSPIMVNLRHLPDELLQKITETMNEIPLEVSPDFVTGIPRAGIPLATAYSTLSGIPFIEVFEKKGTSTERQIAAKADLAKQDGKTLLIVDDLITQGASKIEAIKAAEGVGFKVLGIIVLLDREEGGSTTLRDQGYKVYFALTLMQILDYYLETGKITQERYNGILEYLRLSR